ncbi:exocyst complex component Sec6 [Histoplasma capsulatum var. duboisii H88]|uniref:Exocyst complex component Sec6 n=2 Tax=Ajellomyces capsulatus TaxID=5037 RepID=F0U5E8_AJEC8|nr:exocyst complex component Sec6 [Histoplasma capsulatum var. duboisii H88]QSS52289.1 exocyst complex component Sec6 [Histoplasma capsulatum var. duboisii H88]
MPGRQKLPPNVAGDLASSGRFFRASMCPDATFTVAQRAAAIEQHIKSNKGKEPTVPVKQGSEKLQDGATANETPLTGANAEPENISSNVSSIDSETPTLESLTPDIGANQPLRTTPATTTTTPIPSATSSSTLPVLSLQSSPSKSTLSRLVAIATVKRWPSPSFEPPAAIEASNSNPVSSALAFANAPSPTDTKPIADSTPYSLSLLRPRPEPDPPALFPAPSQPPGRNSTPKLPHKPNMVLQKPKAMVDDSNIDGGVAMPRLEDLLRHPEDLDKIPALKAEYSRKKAAVDAQLREGLRDQLETVQRSISQLTEGQRHVLKTRDELQGIDKLCAESQGTVGDFSQIDKLARIQRNFEATIMMKKGLESFHNDLTEVERLLREDDQDLENQPNLLNAHMAITRLRDFRDEAMDQIRKARDSSNEATLVEWFQRLDSVIEWFDDHVGTAIMNLIPLVQTDNRSMVVRLALIVMNEEKNDSKVRALQEAQKDHKALASRFKSMNLGPKTVRGYKENFLKSIELYAQTQFEKSKETFLDDPEKLEKSFKWFFNDLFTVKQGMQSLMPKKWKIYKVYTNIYHRMMHDWLIEFVDDPELPTANMLAIIHWSEKYYKKMAKLGWKQSDLVPNVLDDREGELVRDWRNLIIKTLDEWMERMFATDKKSFLERDMDALDTNSEGYFRTKTLGDMWRMIHEQLMAASYSDRTDVTEGVIDAMFRALKTRQTTWQTVLDEECARYKNPTTDQSEGLQQLQDWLIAVANDQIACIDDHDEASGQLGYLSRFNRDFEPLVTPKYLSSRATMELDSLRDGYVDLSTHCISLFIDLIFTVDFRTTLPDFFTQKWYSEFAVKRMISTFEDYMSDYSAVLHSSLTDILIEELSDELLVRYLSAIRNKGAKLRRQDPFTDRFKDDVLTVFGFFQKFPDAFAATIKDRWRVVDWLVRLLEAEKAAGVVAVYEAFKTEYWDLQLSWVEAVLRSRDDFERSMVSAVKAKAAELYVERGVETIMGKVR